MNNITELKQKSSVRQNLNLKLDLINDINRMEKAIKTTNSIALKKQYGKAVRRKKNQLRELNRYDHN